METSQAVLLPPLQSPLHSRPEELDLLLPRLGALAYQSIDSENGEIRLLEVLPGYYDDVIQINLHTKNLNDKPRYEALSYAWGTTPSSNRAIVNGCPIPVRESLDLGLRRLRLTDGPRTLWVDALCINQSNLQERSHQVQQMATIYEYATKVTIWLGEWPHLHLCPDSQNCSRTWTEWLYQKSESQYQADDPSHHLCQHALEISKLPWFRRLWIIQEFTLAFRMPHIMLGNIVTESHLLFGVLTVCLESLLTHPATPKTERKQIYQLKAHLFLLSEMADRFSDSGPCQSLYELSAMSLHALATDPRDRIYGLLGIMKSYVAEPILPDYSKAWPQVLAEATMVMISEDGLFPYMIRGFVFPSTEQPKEGYLMPSWVLDISQRIRSDLLEDFEHYYEYAGHKLDSEGTERRRRSLRLSEDFRKLYKHGWHVGTIKSIFVFTPDFPMEGYGQNGRGMRAGLHDFYHQVLKSKGVAPSHLYEAIDSKLDSSYSLEKFVSSLQGHRDEFMPMYRFDRETDKFAVFLTEEGNVGATWLSNTFEIRADDIIVALFERQMPFILRPVPGQSTYRMVNLAYVSGLSGTYIEFHTNVTSGGLDKDEPVPNDWIYDAANGCFEYAIV